MHFISKAKIFIAATAGISLVLCYSVFAATKQNTLPTQRVVLFSSGVGYFEHAGTVNGDARMELRFKTEQINDILKSLLLEDLDGGKAGVVVYPSQDPTAKTLRSFQVDISENPSLAALLNQIRGVNIKATLRGETIHGSILGVEAKPKMLGDKDRVVEVWVLNILTAATIRAVGLDEVQQLEIEDPQLQEELRKALATVALERDKGKKPVTLHFAGEGERRVRFGYVVETPVWKTSYRLILSAATGNKAHLQGWATVENQTENDWDHVDLSLISGRPISFIYNLYQPLYIPRPLLQPELYTSLHPQTYEAGMEAKEEQAEPFAAADEEGLAEKKLAPRRLNSPPVVAPAPEMNSFSAKSVARKPLEPIHSVASIADAGKIGELFQYTVGNVSLPRRQSAMIPIIASDIQAERVSIYNQSVLAKYPLNGVRIVNSSGNHLLQGPLTIFDANTYAGDASIDDIPPGQERLLSYAIDMQVHVDATKTTQDDTLQTGKIVKGILHLTMKNLFTQEYSIDNKSGQEKTIIIEHPFRTGWKLTDSPKPLQTTERLYRFKDTLGPGKTALLRINEEITQSDTLVLLPADFGQLEFYSRSGKIPPKVKDALLKAMTYKKHMLDTERKITDKQREVTAITQGQQRLRENMKTVTQSSQYYSRLLIKLNEQETKIEKLQLQADQLKEEHEKQRTDLEAYLSSTTVE
ncbi:MAG: hypothetical protein HY080_08750 [Gammaproteobacteria bacterium]|nr:hypothetical protein [Gammaproteobacteria bacterium]